MFSGPSIQQGLYAVSHARGESRRSVLTHLIINLATASGATVMGTLYQGAPWIIFGPALLVGAYMSGRVLGLWLGLTPFVATLLAALAFGLNLGVMSDGLGWAFLKSLAIFVMFSMAAVNGWSNTVGKISDMMRQSEETSSCDAM